MQEITALIHLAVAPIFLLSAIASTLLVFAGRLARIVDRGRNLEKIPPSTTRDSELRVLERRARLIYWALVLGVSAALMISLLMTAAFAGPLLRIELAKTAALLFLGALFSYTAALLCLLREVFLGVGSFRLGLRHPQ